MNNPKTELLNLLKKQLKIEINARDRYLKFLKEIDRADFKKVISKIEKDEERHIEIVKKIIKEVEDYKPALKEKKISEKPGKESKISKAIGTTNSILYITNLETYMFKIKRILKQNLSESSKRAVYVSYNKLPKYTKQILEEYGINLKQIVFINCVGVSFGGDTSIDPQDLTKLAITINNTADSMKKPLVIIDTVSAFSIYHNSDLISKFVSSMNDSARRKNYTILWIALRNETEESLNAKLAAFCDEVIKE